VLRREFLPLRSDRHDLAADGCGLIVDLRKAMGIDAAIGAPMSAVEGDGHRAAGAQVLQRDEVRSVVGKQEGGIGSPTAGAWRPAPAFLRRSISRSTMA